MDLPVVTATDIRNLINSPHGDRAVLYLDEDDDTAVWVDAHVNRRRIILSRTDADDFLRGDHSADALAQLAEGTTDDLHANGPGI